MQITLSDKVWNRVYDRLVLAHKSLSNTHLGKDIRFTQDDLYSKDPVAEAVRDFFDRKDIEVLCSPHMEVALVRIPKEPGVALKLTSTGVSIIEAYDRIIRDMVADRMRGVLQEDLVPYIIKPMSVLHPTFKAETLVAHNE